MTSPTAQRPKIKLAKIKLTKPGIILIQSFLIILMTLIELVLRHGIGILTGLTILFASVGGVHLGRPGTSYLTAVTPPIAFASFLLMAVIVTDGPHPSKVGVDFIATLAGAAPYLILGACYSWFHFFKSRKK